MCVPLLARERFEAFCACGVEFRRGSGCVWEKASDEGDRVTGPCCINVLPGRPSPRSVVRKSGFLWPLLVLSGFSLGC